MQMKICTLSKKHEQRNAEENTGNKTQNPLKFVGVPQTPEPISAVSRP